MPKEDWVILTELLIALGIMTWAITGEVGYSIAAIAAALALVALGKRAFGEMILLVALLATMAVFIVNVLSKSLALAVLCLMLYVLPKVVAMVHVE